MLLIELIYIYIFCYPFRFFLDLLSELVGYLIILCSVLVRVPQVLKLIENKSSEGISLFAVLLDLTAITLNMSYNYVMGHPFSSWGDTTFLALQTAAIGALVLFYAGAEILSVIFCITYAAIVRFLISSYTPLYLLDVAQSLYVPTLIGSKLIQALTNYKNGSTGQLSATTVSLECAVGMCNTIQGAVLTIANGVIVAQVIQCWIKTENAKEEAEKAEKAERRRREEEEKARLDEDGFGFAVAGISAALLLGLLSKN